MTVLEVVTVADAARRLGVTNDTLRTYIQRGQTPSIKIGNRRYLLASLVDALAEEKALTRSAVERVAQTRREPRRR